MYTAKYLPVEGDTCFINRQLSRKIENKLFLISDDIQVGDVAQNQYGIGGLVENELELSLLNKAYFKVIGEIINPEGIVEGQAFTRDQYDIDLRPDGEYFDVVIEIIK